jgi:tripartite-type tricarboxylate transporter receptor subunit TctC
MMNGPTLADVPCVSEFLPAYETSYWIGLGAPKDTPTEIIENLNKEINSAIVDPTITARFDELDGMAMPGSSASFGKLIVEETDRWRESTTRLARWCRARRSSKTEGLPSARPTTVVHTWTYKIDKAA